MYIYIFGSICRGEIDKQSDVDLLAVVENGEDKSNFDINKFSVYTVKRLKEMWQEGNPFAWHLFIESKLVFSNNHSDLFQMWGQPNLYSHLRRDLEKFFNLFNESIKSINESKSSIIFDLSMIFLAIRNFASCYSLGHLKDYNFSRYSALNLKSSKLEVSSKSFEILERARIFSTRGVGELITKKETEMVLSELDIIKNWFQRILDSI